MRLILLLLSFAFISLQAQNGKKNYIFEQISLDAGFVYNAISSIVEHDQGFIWLDSDNGLFYYNDNEIIKHNFDHKNENSLPSNKINELYTYKMQDYGCAQIMVFCMISGRLCDNSLSNYISV